MEKELFFLRSSEQKIVADMSKMVYQDARHIALHSDFYGLSRKDLGIYALVNNILAGAIWFRHFSVEHNVVGFVDENIAVMSLAVVEESQYKEIATFMLEQFLLEASHIGVNVSVYVGNNALLKELCLEFGFENIEEDILVKKLEKQEIIRPTDGYDPSKWLD